MKQPPNNKQWNGKSRGGAFGHKFFVVLIRVFGLRAAYTFLIFVVPHFVLFAPKATAAVWQYNRNILHYGIFKSFCKLFQHYYIFGQTIIDKVAINNGLIDRFHFEFENYDNFLRVLDNGATTILSAHIGCWGIGANYYGDYEQRMNIVMYSAEYDKIKAVLESQTIQYKVIPVNDGGIESLLKIKQALDNNEYVCFQGDRYVDASSANKQTFMQHEALFPTGPTLIASKFKTPVVIYFAMRERGRKYRFKFHIIDQPMTKEELMNIYISTLEKTIKQYPQQWFNFYKFWS